MPRWFHHHHRAQTLGITLLILSLVHAPWPQADFHNVRHHDEPGQVCEHHDHLLRYVGRMDDSPRDASKATTHELADAVEALLANRTVAIPVTEPIGCTVKWWGKPPKFVPTDVCDLQ